jgi:hypothetical protein
MGVVTCLTEESPDPTGDAPVGTGDKPKSRSCRGPQKTKPRRRQESREHLLKRTEKQVSGYSHGQLQNVDGDRGNNEDRQGMIFALAQRGLEGRRQQRRGQKGEHEPPQGHAGCQAVPLISAAWSSGT